MPETTVTYDPAKGSVSLIYYDEAQPLAKALGINSMAQVKRASHVEPVDGGWNVDLTPVGGPQSLCVCATRKEALKAEVDWLKVNL